MSVVKTVNCLMMAIVSSRRIAIDDSVAAMPQRDHTSCRRNLLKLFWCESVLVDLLKRLLAQQ
eukprot:5742846-Amphidinium_carterae.1